MVYSYYDDNGNIKKINIQVGMSWDEVKTGNENIDSIFNEIDDGDGYVQFTEKVFVEKFLENIDSQDSKTARNNTLERDELDSFNIDIAKLKQSLTVKDFSWDTIQKQFPRNKYKIAKTDIGYKITEIKSGKEVLTYYELGTSKTVKETTKTGKNYKIDSRKTSLEIYLNNTKSAVERLYDFDNGKLLQIKDSKLNVRDVENEFEKIVKERVNWNSRDAIKYIDNFEDGKLYKFLDDLHQEKQVYILDEIARNENIPEQERKDFIERTLKRLEKEAGYKEEYSKENDLVQNDIYTSKHSYSYKFDHGKLTVTMNPQEGTDEEPITRTIDIDRLLSKVQVDLRPSIKAGIQRIPGEALMLLATECDYFNPVDNEKGIDGKFVKKEDRIIVGYNHINRVDESTIVHELGHALDLSALSKPKIYEIRSGSIVQQVKISDYRDFHITDNEEFYKAYEESKFEFLGMENYLKTSDNNEIAYDKEALRRDGYMDEEGYWTEKFANLTDSYMYQLNIEGASEMLVFILLGNSSGTDKAAVKDKIRDCYIKLYEERILLPPEERHDKEA